MSNFSGIGTSLIQSPVIVDLLSAPGCLIACWLPANRCRRVAGGSAWSETGFFSDRGKHTATCLETRVMILWYQVGGAKGQHQSQAWYWDWHCAGLSHLTERIVFDCPFFLPVAAVSVHECVFPHLLVCLRPTQAVFKNVLGLTGWARSHNPFARFSALAWQASAKPKQMRWQRGAD